MGRDFSATSPAADPGPAPAASPPAQTPSVSVPQNPGAELAKGAASGWSREKAMEAAASFRASKTGGSIPANSPPEATQTPQEPAETDGNADTSKARDGQGRFASTSGDDAKPVPPAAPKPGEPAKGGAKAADPVYDAFAKRFGLAGDKGKKATADLLDDFEATISAEPEEEIEPEAAAPQPPKQASAPARPESTNRAPAAPQPKPRTADAGSPGDELTDQDLDDIDEFGSPALKKLASKVRQQDAALRDTRAFQDAQRQQQAAARMNQATHQIVLPFFDQAVKDDPVLKEIYGVGKNRTRAQVAACIRVSQDAARYAMAKDQAGQGASISDEDAMHVALLATHRDRFEASAKQRGRAEVEAAIVRRDSQADVIPAGGSGPPQTRELPLRERQLSAAQAYLAAKNQRTN